MICTKLTVTDTSKKFIGEHIWIFCPGCQEAHALWVSGEGHPVWNWNGDLDKPTFSPSLRIFHPATKEGPQKTICHSFIKNGQIQFLGDCSHDLKGQTVPLPELPDWLQS